MTEKCGNCEKHKTGDCKCKDCPECAVLFDNDGNYHGSVCDSHSETCKICKGEDVVMTLDEIKEWYKHVVISVDELRKLYDHEQPFGKTKVFVTSQKAWDNLGKLSTTPTETLEPCPCCGSTRIHVVAPDDGCYCWDCGLTMPNRPNWRERWNRRVN